jgi:ribosomal 30S subunit maturation factor RimM
MVTVGRIMRPHGLKGAGSGGAHVGLCGGSVQGRLGVAVQRLGQAVPGTVVESRDFKGRWVVRLEGVTTISEAEALRGLDLEVPADARHPLKAGALLHGRAGRL